MSKITKNAFRNFGSNRPVELAGTTAYFAIFSIVPVIIIIISVFGIFMGDESIQNKLFNEINDLIGKENTQVLELAINNYNIIEKSKTGTIIGLIIFFISATALFSALQNSINFIWRVKTKSNLRMNLLNVLKTRVLSFGVILSVGFVLLISLIVEAIIAYFKDFLAAQFNAEFVILAQITNYVVSVIVVAAVFTLIYRFLPDVHVRWNASWFGGIFTSILFTIGKFAIGIVIGNSNLGQVYGAASSIVIILIWIFFTSIIFYFGVELTRQYSKFYNHHNPPVSYAIPFEFKVGS